MAELNIKLRSLSFAKRAGEQLPLNDFWSVYRCQSIRALHISMYRQNIIKQREGRTEVSLCTSGDSFSTQEICSNRVWQRRSTQCCTFSDSSRSSLSVSETWCRGIDRAASDNEHQTLTHMQTHLLRSQRTRMYNSVAVELKPKQARMCIIHIMS